MSDNNGGIIRSRKQNFTMIDNTVLKDESLSLKAKGLYAMIMLYITIPNFALHKKFLMSKCIEGKSSFHGAWMELQNKGYLVQYKIPNYNNSGKFGYEYELCDTPVLDTENQHLEKDKSLQPENRYLENQDTTFLGTENQDLGNRDVESLGTENQGVDFLGLENRGCINNTNNNNNNTYINNTLSFNHTKTMVEGMIEYDLMFKNQDYQSIVDEMVLIMTEVIMSDKKNSYKINNVSVSVDVIKGVLMKVNYQNIKNVVDTFVNGSKNIKNVKGYLLTMIYNSITTINSYYTNMAKINGDI